MIVMKFGGTSVADAERILAAAEIVRSWRDRSPLVVVSALGGVTDLLLRAVAGAGAGERETLEPVLADLERRHRWAVAGCVHDPRARHELNLDVERKFEDLRQLLRSVRTLGEVTARVTDALLAFGEVLSSRILTEALRERGLPVRYVDPRHVMITDGRHGAAEPDLDAVATRARERILPVIEADEIPVTGGFVGATTRGDTTTLGRGGSDTSAAVLGSVLEAEEIQIWTDVDGLMSADPRLVPRARTLERVSFAEAAELAFYGARVLHPASIAPAVRRQIPVRVLNSLRAGGPGTLIVGESDPAAPPLASVASRTGVCAVRVSARTLRVSRGFLSRVLRALEGEALAPDLVVSSEAGVIVVLPDGADLGPVSRALGPEAEVRPAHERAVLCVVGSGLSRSEKVRGEVLEALAALGPEMVALGGSGTSVTVVVPAERLEPGVREIHRRFFEGGSNR